MSLGMVLNKRNPPYSYVTDYRHCRDTGSQLGRLRDSQRHPIYWLQITVPISATYYPLTRLLTQSSTLFVLSSPHSSCMYRGSRATFTIKSLMQFLTLQSLQLLYIRKHLLNRAIMPSSASYFKLKICLMKWLEDCNILLNNIPIVYSKAADFDIKRRL